MEIERQRNVEAAVVAVLIESYPESLTLSALIDALTVEVARQARTVEVEEAAAGLTEAGLIQYQGPKLVPTRTALRAAELDLGLA